MATLGPYVQVYESTERRERPPGEAECGERDRERHVASVLRPLPICSSRSQKTQLFFSHLGEISVPYNNCPPPPVTCTISVPLLPGRHGHSLTRTHWHSDTHQTPRHTQVTHKLHAGTAEPNPHLQRNCLLEYEIPENQSSSSIFKSCHVNYPAEGSHTNNEAISHQREGYNC